ncbi:MAG: histidinol phosphatase [Candidatus Hydrogenedentota bacterium]
MLEDAKRAKVSVIMLTDHFRPPRDFMDSWRGLRDGVLFIPGSESHGFLLYPETSVMAEMEGTKEGLIKAVGAGEGFLFLSHVEERVEHAMDGLLGMEVYNRHADAKDDMALLMTVANWATDPKQGARLTEMIAKYPEEVLAAQCDYDELYMGKWDRESQTRRVVGVAANDCHHNQVFIVKMVDDQKALLGTIVDPDEDMREVTVAQKPSLAELMKGHKPGDIVAKFDFDPYWASFHNESTHILAPELTEPAIRAALKEGHAYVAHDWMCDPTGFGYIARKGDGPIAIMGDEVKAEGGVELLAVAPSKCLIRILSAGKTVVQETADTARLENAAPGVYRVECWLEVDGEMRPWIYSNPIYVR